jgi:hypothetical protein
MTPEVRLELQRLLSALCDGELSEAQHTRLEELLDADADCRRHYLEYLDLHARLLTHPLGEQEPTCHPAPRSGFRVPPFVRYALVAVTTLAASLLVQVCWWRLGAPDGGPGSTPGNGTEERPLSGYVATLTRTVDCVWVGPAGTRRVGSRLAPGALRLRKGVAQIRFDSGTELVVEGPAELSLDSGTAATVLRGKVVFRADETAAAFELHTPSSTLIDFGTEYAVAVGPEDEEVHVFDGEVQRTGKSAGAPPPERLTAGDARRYGRTADAPGQPTPLDPERFVRQPAGPGQPHADPADGLLAYEGFDYADPNLLPAGKANGGVGWTSPWRPGFARPLNEGDKNVLALNVKETLTRPGAAVPAVGGCFDYTGFTKYFRRLATPVHLNADGVYYLSFLFRRHGPPADPLNAVAVLLRTNDELEDEHRKKEDPRKRLNVGVGGFNHVFTHLNRVGVRTPLPLAYGETYLLVAKIAASGASPDQVFIRVYGPREPVEREDPGSWSVTGPPFQSDLVFDWLEVHINSKTRQTIDEIRLGTTWASVTAPWAGGPLRP